MGGHAEITLEQGARMRARLGEHELVIDLPKRLGGTNQAPNPSQLFVLSIAACQLYYAYKALSRRGINTDGAFASVEWETGESCIERVTARVRMPAALDESAKQAAQRMMDACFVKLSISHPVEIVCTIE